MLKYFFSILALCAGFFMTLRNLCTGPAEPIRSVPARQKVVALTFDDGPHPVYTRQLVDILSKYHVKATFFMVGRAMRQYPETVRAVLDKGHAVGNHTYSHPPNLASCADRRVAREIAACQKIIARQIGAAGPLPCAIFRPPRGLYDRPVLAIARDQGLETVLWTVCGNNRRATTPQLIAARVTSRIRPGGIILLHDGNFDCRWKDVEATQLIIANLLRRGYRFVTVPQLLALRRLRPAAAPDPDPDRPQPLDGARYCKEETP